MAQRDAEQDKPFGSEDIAHPIGPDDDDMEKASDQAGDGVINIDIDDCGLPPGFGESTGDDDVAGLQKERDELQAKLIRVSADYQNFVRRSHQNTVDARQQQQVLMAKALVVPLDHFDHALAVDITKTTAQSLMEGMNIVRDELLKAIEQFGVQRLEVQPGEAFDPSRHEALMYQEADGVEPGCIANQIQPGYLLGEITIRPAKVAVAK